MKKITEADFSFVGPQWEDVSPDCKKLIKRMLTKSQKERISSK